MGFGLKQICMITAVGTGVIAGVAIASRNDYSTEKMWNKTKKNVVKMTKRATKIINSKKNEVIEVEKSDSETLMAASLARVIDVVLEDSEIIVANENTNASNTTEDSTESHKIITLPSINQVKLFLYFIFYILYFIFIFLSFNIFFYFILFNLIY